MSGQAMKDAKNLIRELRVKIASLEAENLVLKSQVEKAREVLIGLRDECREDKARDCENHCSGGKLDQVIARSGFVLAAPTQPTAEQIEAAKKLCEELSVMVHGERRPVHYDKDNLGSVAQFLAARDQSVAAEAVNPWERLVEFAISMACDCEAKHRTGEAFPKHHFTCAKDLIEKRRALLSTPPAPAPTEKKP